MEDLDRLKYPWYSDTHHVPIPKTTYPKQGEKPINTIEKFIQASKGYLITEDELFTGCEAQNLIYIFYGDGLSVDESVRCALSRCVSNLCIIEIVNEYSHFEFEGVLEVNDFFHCLKNCKSGIYKCETCNHLASIHIWLCTVCRIKCHTNDHTFKKRDVSCDLKTDVDHCMCPECSDC